MASRVSTSRTVIVSNLDAVRGRIARACEQAGRDPAEVTLIGVSKTVPPDIIRLALDAGLRDLGENYVQEALGKKSVLTESTPGPRWHLIGHLQTNKVAEALQTFDIIHAVDSLRLAEALHRRATSTIPVLLEVNAAGEASKFGFAPAEVAAAVAEISKLASLDLRGLMTVAPAVDNPEDVRPVFAALRGLARANGLAELSMGMTGDFDVAIQEGATMVRIGRAIFGERRR